jgi:YbbR domain-containing protein
MTRTLRFILHNWPLKVAAVAVATLLYGGLVLSQTTQPFTDPVPIRIENSPADVIVLSNLGSVTRISYVAPPDLGLRIDRSTFEAAVDLSTIQPAGQAVSVDVTVEAVDDRIQVLDFEPRAISITVDRLGSREVPVEAILQPLPSGLEAGDPVVETETAIVSGPQSVVATVVKVQAEVSIDATGVDVNELVPLIPVDINGDRLGEEERIDVEPAVVRVRVPVFTDRRTKSLPVTPFVAGTPAAGFEIESVTVDPAVVNVEGDANDLAALDQIDTAQVVVSGASSELVQDVSLVLPPGVQAIGSGTVQVTVRLRPKTATRTFQAGLILVGARPDRRYELSTDSVLVTITGSVADLDRLATTSFSLTVDVTGFDPGTHVVEVSANLTAGLSLQNVSPNPIEVTVSIVESSPGPTAGPSPAP